MMAVLMICIVSVSGYRYSYSIASCTKRHNPLWSAINSNDERFSHYKELGLSDHDIYKFFNLKQILLRALRQTFGYSRRTCSYHHLYHSVKNYINFLEYIEDQYLSNINNVVLGNNVHVQGEENFVHTDNFRVKGNNNYVFTQQHHGNRKIHGDDILRIGRFEIDLTKV